LPFNTTNERGRSRHSARKLLHDLEPEPVDGAGRAGHHDDLTSRSRKRDPQEPAVRREVGERDRPSPHWDDDVGKVPLDGFVERDESVAREIGEQRRRKDFRDRADLEDRVLVGCLWAVVPDAPATDERRLAAIRTSTAIPTCFRARRSSTSPMTSPSPDTSRP